MTLLNLKTSQLKIKKELNSNRFKSNQLNFKKKKMFYRVYNKKSLTLWKIFSAIQVNKKARKKIKIWTKLGSLKNQKDLKSKSNLLWLRHLKKVILMKINKMRVTEATTNLVLCLLQKVKRERKMMMKISLKEVKYRKGQNSLLLWRKMKKTKRGKIMMTTIYLWKRQMEKANEAKLLSQVNRTVSLILVLLDHNQGPTLVLAQVQVLVQAQAQTQIVRVQVQVMDQDLHRPLK